MAKIKQGILGGFSGKVANVVGTSWKGRAVMKSQPLSVANPKTEAQQEQRGKFSKIAELASAVLTQFVQLVENPISGDISGYNLFCKDNKGAFNASGNLVAANCVCGGGKIINVETPVVSASVANQHVELQWTNGAEISALRLTDKIYAFAAKEDGSVILMSEGGDVRSDEGITMDVFVKGASFAASDKFVVFYAAVSADGREVSVKTTAKSATAA